MIDYQKMHEGLKCYDCRFADRDLLGIGRCCQSEEGGPAPDNNGERPCEGWESSHPISDEIQMLRAFKKAALPLLQKIAEGNNPFQQEAKDALAILTKV